MTFKALRFLGDSSFIDVFIFRSGWCSTGKMVVPPDNSCCFCLTLRTGVILIGAFNFTIYLLAFLWYVKLVAANKWHNKLALTALEANGWHLKLVLLQVFLRHIYKLHN
jgi:hypothetical protein